MRKSGVLLPISSLPSKYGIGCFSKDAYRFIDWLSEAGQSFWQILPLGPTGYGDSPYQSFSAFAGNPYFISLQDLVDNNLLTNDECDSADFGSDEEHVDYEKIYTNRFRLLRLAFERSDCLKNPQYTSFCEREKEWLDDYALFMALKEHFDGNSWYGWQTELRKKCAETVQKYRAELDNDIQFWKFIQFLFDEQWHKLKSYANSKGISIIGDIPIYASSDSVDVWANPELFLLDGDRNPVVVAGCPPDGFSKKGQLWGNPLYNWETHRKTGYSWWIMRLRHCFKLYDVVRIDHFRGFDEFYSIPYGAEDATVGRWEKGPGIELFNAVKNAIDEKKIIAEDLGFITDSVRNLVKECGYDGMKILEFAFDERDTGEKNDYLPHNYIEKCTAYTATHDNQTLRAWLDSASDLMLSEVREYLCDHYTPIENLNKSLIALLMRSRAELCIIPMQDWLGFDDSARINTPATVGRNWTWRMSEKMLCEELKNEIFKMTKIYGRI